MENIIIPQQSQNEIKPLNDIFNTDKEYNTKMLLEVPGLKDTIVPTLGNQFFFPKQFNLLKEELDKVSEGVTVDEHGYIHTEITVDNSPVIFHQHVSALSEKDKSYYPTNALNFNIEGMKIIFENKIPLCFKQTVALMALSCKDPNILTLGFEKDELIEITYSLKETLNLSYEELSKI